MNYYIYILFLPMMFISIMFMLICSSWFSLWMIMELNMISLIMVMMFDKNIKYELLMKYYLLQSMLSYLFLINCLGIFTETFFPNSIMIMNFSILMKLSLFPFHFWYIKIMLKLNWINIYYFSIINKIIPIYIMNNIMNINFILLNYFNYFLLFISSFFSAVIGLNQTNLKSIMGYSSMIQLSWLIILINFNELISLMYFLIYNFISMEMYYMYYLININSFVQLISLKLNNKYMLFINMILIMSLSGLPPFFGFLMKWLSIQMLILMNFNFWFLLLFIFNSLISMYFYLRITFMIFMNYYLINKTNFKFINLNNKFNFKFIWFNWIMLFMMLMYQIM